MKQPVWDLPVRLVHWLLAALIAFSWWSVHNHHTDWHIWSGIAILTLLIFRLLWGFFGSSTARWTGFIRGPRGVVDYLRGRVSPRVPNPRPSTFTRITAVGGPGKRNVVMTVITWTLPLV